MMYLYSAHYIIFEQKKHHFYALLTTMEVF